MISKSQGANGGKRSCPFDVLEEPPWPICSTVGRSRECLTALIPAESGTRHRGTLDCAGPTANRPEPTGTA
jgi:hypothetical protein